MSTKSTNIILFIILVCSFLVSVYIYPELPERIASHWNAYGEVDGYMSKFWGVFLMPFILVFMFGLYLVVPRLDPLKNNLEKSRKYFNLIMLFIFGFMFYVFVLVLAWNLGYRFNFTTLIIPAIALLFFIIGFAVEKTKRNWFMGIRTPWTLSSDEVWDKTHKLGGILFKVSGALALAGLLFNGEIAFLFVIAPAIFSALIAVVYSYFLYKRINI